MLLVVTIVVGVCVSALRPSDSLYRALRMGMLRIDLADKPGHQKAQECYIHS